jgi:nucleotide-binding universal stress UspA family protein
MTPAVVLCAVDLGPSTGRVLYHAAGLARLLDAALRIVHVTADDTVDLKDRVVAQCQNAAPYEVAIDDDAIVVAHGRVSEAIQREALRANATLIVVGSRGHGGLASLLIGSTCEALLGLARTPVLLVPPTDMDIVNLGDRTALTCGPVLAAVDLAEACDHHLLWASRMAGLAAHSR